MFIQVINPDISRNRVEVTFHEGVLQNRTFKISLWLFINLVYMQKLDVSHLEDARGGNLATHFQTVLNYRKTGKKEGLMKYYTEDDFELISELAEHFKKVLK